LKIGDAMSFLVARYTKDEDTPESVIDVSSVDADAHVRGYRRVGV